jgi:hypothetical protein
MLKGSRMRYDKEFAQRKGRKEVSDPSSCGVCAFLKCDTASKFEWPCLILDDWICETHCTEVKLPDVEDTRRSIRARNAKFKGVEIHEEVDLVDDICVKCPYFSC